MNAAKNEIRANYNKLATAWKNKDRQGCMKFYSLQFKRITKNRVVGTRKEEQSALEKLLGGVLQVESVELKIKKIEVKGRTVVVSLPVMWSFVNHDHAHEMLACGDLDTWAQEKEGWRIISSNSGTGKFWAGHK